ncbi:unnamed protein product [Protopolystoma xenopodis]|uniref:Uncharacterized protein n=1 Tax=Protopolystoma xenopodis TaxID=117903 RepID=A0A448XE62_9PLAT|nr:unnamed protein product [Protopolystoma xenopodis]
MCPVHRLVDHTVSVTSENCASKLVSDLVLPGEVSFGAEVQFEMEARIALRLAHFLSAYYQNDIIGERYGSLKSGFPLNRFELFGEVFANVLSSFQIVSSGIFFDFQRFKDQDGTIWDLFAPFAYKPRQSTQTAEALDMSLKGYRDYPEKIWFRALKVGN